MRMTKLAEAKLQTLLTRVELFVPYALWKQADDDIKALLLGFVEVCEAKLCAEDK